MSPEPKHRPDAEEEWEEPPGRSIFSAGWFRALLAAVVLAVLVVGGLPYLLDWWTPAPPPPPPVVKAPIPPPPPALETPPAQKAEAPKTLEAPPPAKREPAPPQIPPKAVPREAKASARPEARTPELIREQPGATVSPSGNYWIQVGAFKDQANATRLTAQLSAENFPAQHVPLDRPVGGTHEVFVVGTSEGEVSGKLPAKDYRAKAAGAEVVIQPALPLKDAVSLSKELARQGLTVKIRRANSTATFHVVRVGGYADRQHAQAVQKDLAGKGFSGFIVKGEGR